MPTIKPLAELANDWPQISELLDEALALAPAERRAWMEGLDARHACVLPTLRLLLGSDSRVETDDFLATMPKLGASRAGHVGEPAAGDVVGPWRLLRELGEGGMGSVWLAERVDGQLKRQVALKLPRLGWARGLAERMARERDILATLEHPNVSRLYDAGVDQLGRPWLALEYVQGQPIDAYCRQRGLTTHQRVALLLQVCDAVSYAHRLLVIHRDLKPSNILVTDKGQVRLLDFGIAKLALPSPVGNQGVALTEFGGMALTAGYASPEQLREEPLSTASDVFSLGVVGYELLAERRPFEFQARSVLAYERALAQGPAPLASRVSVDRAKAGMLQGDLDAVLDRALQVDLSKRYVGVEEFAGDLRAWLAGDAVSARRRTTAQQVGHWMRRHKSAVAAGVFVLLTLAAATAVSTWQALRAREQAAHAAAEATKARKEAARAQATQALLNRIFQLNSVDQPDPQQAQRTTVRELLDLAARSVGDVMKDTPEAQVDMLETLSGLYAQLGANGPALRSARDRVEIARRALPASDLRRADALLLLAGRLHDTPQRAEARALLDEAEAVMKLAGPAVEALPGALALQRARHERWGRVKDGVSHAEQAVAWFREHRPDAGLRPTALYFAAVLNDMAGDPERALQHLSESRRIAEAKGAGGGRALLTAVAERGDLLARRGLWVEADAAHAEAVEVATRLHGRDNPSTLVTIINRARFLIETGRVAQGHLLWQDVQQRMRDRQPPLEGWWMNYARLLMQRLDLERGRPDLLEPLTRAGIARLADSVPESSVAAHRHLLLAEVLMAMDRLDEAEGELRRAQAIWSKVIAGLERPGLGEAFTRAQAALLLARGDAEGALTLLDAMPRGTIVATSAADRAETRRQLLRSAALLKLGQVEAALAAARAAESELRRLSAPLRWPAQEADTALALGLALRAAGQSKEAEIALRRAVAERQAYDLPGSRWLALAEGALVGERGGGGKRNVGPAALPGTRGRVATNQR